MAKEAAKVIQKPETDAHAALDWLVEGGLLEASGDGKGRAHYLSIFLEEMNDGSCFILSYPNASLNRLNKSEASANKSTDGEMR
jgi:hypothetical protein